MISMEKVLETLLHDLKQKVGTVLEVVAEVEFEYSRVISTLVFSKNEFDRLYDRERRIALGIRREGIAR